MSQNRERLSGISSYPEIHGIARGWEIQGRRVFSNEFHSDPLRLSVAKVERCGRYGVVVAHLKTPQGTRRVRGGQLMAGGDGRYIFEGRVIPEQQVENIDPAKVQAAFQREMAKLTQGPSQKEGQVTGISDTSSGSNDVEKFSIRKGQQLRAKRPRFGERVYEVVRIADGKVILRRVGEEGRDFSADLTRLVDHGRIGRFRVTQSLPVRIQDQ